MTSGCRLASMQVSGPSGITSGARVSTKPSADEEGVYICEGCLQIAGLHYLTVFLNGTDRIAGTPLKVRVLDLGTSGAVLSGSTGVELEGTEPDGVAVGAHYGALQKRATSQPRTSGDVALSVGGDLEGGDLEGGDLEGGAASDFEISAFEILPTKLRCAIEGETARLDAHLKLRLRSGPGVEVGVVSGARARAEAFARAAVCCRYEGADEGEALLHSLVTLDTARDPSPTTALHLTFEFVPRRAGMMRLRVELRAPASAVASAVASASSVASAGGRPPPLAAEPIKVFSALVWRFHHLGVLSSTDPFTPLPADGTFYDVVAATPACMYARPLALL